MLFKEKHSVFYNLFTTVGSEEPSAVFFLYSSKMTVVQNTCLRDQTHVSIHFFVCDFLLLRCIRYVPLLQVMNGGMEKECNEFIIEGTS